MAEDANAASAGDCDEKDAVFGHQLAAHCQRGLLFYVQHAANFTEVKLFE
jgi:hypothetical protein